MDRRLELQAKLESILGSSNVYFQPPGDVRMAYPAIVYKRDYANTTFANNAPYFHEKRYQLTLIDRDPDSVFYDLLAAQPKCVFVRNYVADGLNHDIFNIYF